MKKEHSDIHAFFVDQLSHWSLAKKNFNNLRFVVEKTICIGEFPIKLQFNPERIRSTAANVDSNSISQRKCFLCQNNRPQEQMILDEIVDYDVLVNPYPIFKHHFTICHSEHIHQDCINFREMVRFAEMHKDLVVFYNASKSGASAPDHLHFQAGDKDALPICEYIDKGEWTFNIDKHDLKIRVDDSLPMPFFHIRCSCKLSNINRIIDSLTFEKSYRNVMMWSTDSMIEILIFPRSKHRPDCYFAKDEKQIMVSPGAVDMAGCLILPRKEDFDKMDKQIIESIYNEVSVNSVEMKEKMLQLQKVISKS